MNLVGTFSDSKLVRRVPIVTVDLTLPAHARWREVLAQCDGAGVDYKMMLADTRRQLDQSLLKGCIVDIRSNTRSLLGGILRGLLFSAIALVGRLFFLYWQDIVALATLLKMNPGELLLANILYEILGGCTSFICADKGDSSGRPLLARTLDWPLLELAKYTVQFEWKDAHGTLFYSVGWLGYVGVMTGCKPRAFAISLNARYPDMEANAYAMAAAKYCYHPQNDDVQTVSQMLTSILNRARNALRFSGWTTGGIIRYAFEQKFDFETALNFLVNEPLLVPCYFIIAGNKRGDGAVITRDMLPPVSTSVCSVVRRLSTSVEYLVQTNSDFPQHFTIASGKPPVDFNSVERYEVCSHEILKRNCGSSGIMISCSDAARILTTSLNKGVGVRMKMTLYFSVMTPYENAERAMVCARPTRHVGP